MMRRPFSAGTGQMVPLLALSLAVICGMLALSVDVGLTTSRQHVLRNTADNASIAGARMLLSYNAESDHDVWTAMSSTLTMTNLILKNPTGATPSTSPCSLGYSHKDVAMTAVFLDAYNKPITGVPQITDTTAITPPINAAGVQVAL